MEGLVMTLQLMLALTILVAVHEFGHFISAKYFKMRVDKFFIFFDPWFKIFSKKVKDTVYGFGWLPLGGYVKIAGMLDESFDKEQLNKPPKPWEFRSKPAWQRIIVMVGGVTMNIILGMAIFCLLIFIYGDSYLPSSELNKHGIVAHELARSIGLKTGDKIIELNGTPVKKYKDIVSTELLFGDNVELTVMRDGSELVIPIPDNFADLLADAGSDMKENFISPRTTFTVGAIAPESNAEIGGLLTKDKILKVNDVEIEYFDQFKNILKEKSGDSVVIIVNRQEQIVELNIKVTSEGTIGFISETDIKYATATYGFFESIAFGSVKAWKSLFDSIRGIGKIFSGKISFKKAMHGPIGIATIYGGQWDWKKFWTLTGVLSMWLAFINIVPIPALDGGHVLFLVYEVVSGRKPGDKFMEVMQIIGVIILMALMVFIIGNDIVKMF